MSWYHRRPKIHRADWLPDGTRVPLCRAKSKGEPKIADEVKFVTCKKCRKIRQGAALPGEI